MRVRLRALIFWLRGIGWVLGGVFGMLLIHAVDLMVGTTFDCRHVKRDFRWWGKFSDILLDWAVMSPSRKVLAIC